MLQCRRVHELSTLCAASQAGCSAEAQALGAEVAAKQAELADARAEQERCQTRQEALTRDIAETERRLQARSPCVRLPTTCLSSHLQMFCLADSEVPLQARI